uniref:Uncharacterized protein n=1 Tax=Caulobacter phage BL57 TaxID=3348355 RepID=A0AB74UNL8_9VIRU
MERHQGHVQPRDRRDLGRLQGQGILPRAREGEHENVGKLYWALLSPYPHVLAGYLKKAQDAKNIEPAILRDFPIAFFTEALPLNDMLVALKPLIGKRAPKKTKVQIEREGKERTCQVCGRGILAENGRIAHHGYQRPGMGYQTASCSGALELPFEISRDALGADIENLKAYRARRQAYRSSVNLELTSLPVKYQVSEQDPRRAPGFKHVVDKMIHVTRADWDAQKAATPEAFAGKYGPVSPTTPMSPSPSTPSRPRSWALSTARSSSSRPRSGRSRSAMTPGSRRRSSSAGATG